MNTNPLTNLVKSSFVSRYVSSLFVLGFDNRSQVRYFFILATASLLLSISSLYTTFDGLTQVVNSIIAILLALGIQGLLYTASWRIGVVRGTSNFPFYLRIIYGVCLIFSVVFSFVSFFNTLYPISQQKYDELNSLRSQSYEISEQASIIASNISNREIDSVRIYFGDWYRIVANDFEDKIVATLQPFRSKKIVYDELVNKADLELSEGYSANSPGGGDGRLHKRYRREADEYYRSNVATYGTRIIELDSLYNTFTVLSKGFIDSQEKITSGKIFSIENAYRGILARLNYQWFGSKLGRYFAQFSDFFPELPNFSRLRVNF